MALRVLRVTRSADSRRSVHRRPTLADVARLAGVSAKTVSRVYADPEAVADATRKAVLAAADRLSFRPNALARDLRRGGKASMIAFVTAEFTNPFYIQVASGIEREFSQHGYTMLLAACDDREGERSVIESLVSHRVSCVLFVPIGDDHSFLEGERRMGLSIVAIDRPACNLVADSVVLDNRRGAYLATRSLLSHGHRRVGYVCNPVGVYTQAERLTGYRDAHAEAGVPLDPTLIKGSDRSDVSLESLVDELLGLPDPPTAIVGGNNRATAAAVRRLRLHGEDIAYVGFDDLEFGDAFGISVIQHDPHEMGRVAARRALARLADPTGIAEDIVMPVSYVARGSGERPPR